MRLTVLNWIKDGTKGFVATSIEAFLRVLLFFLPLGLFMLLLQLRSKASKVSGLTAFTTQQSEWQQIYPGYILVAIDPHALEKYIERTNKGIQAWVTKYKYTLCLLFATILVVIMLVK